MPSIIPSPGAPGTDPNVSATIELSRNYVVAAGTTLFASDLDPLMREYGFTFPPLTLLNQGTLWVRGAGAHTIAAFNLGQLDNRGLIVAQATAGDAQAIQVSSTWDGGLTNSGRIFALASHASIAIADWSSSAIIQNSGLIAAQATQGGATAIARQNGGAIVNTATGAILAEGASAVAISLGNGHTYISDPFVPVPPQPNRPDVDNQGLIEAVATDPSLASVAIAAISLEGSEMTIRNAGTIRGDYAIFSDASPVSTPQHSVQTVINEAGGLIDGAIVLGLGDDVVVNRGTIAGYVDLGDDDDLFDSSAGTFVGTAALGWGNDRFLGGNGAEAALGDRGDDQLSGGGGDDLLLGGRGNDRIEGGAGNDGLYGEYGDDVIVTAGGDRVLGGDGDDIVILGDYGFASVDGGAGRDTLVLAGGPRLLDLSAALATGRLAGFEAIRLPGAETLVLRAADIAALSGGGNLLTIEAGADGRLDLVGAWSAGEVRTIGGADFRLYSAGDRQVLVSTAAATTILAEAPAGAAGLDEVAAGAAAPQPGDWPGAALTPSATYVSDYLSIESSLVIERDEVWTAAPGVTPLAAGDPFLDIVNQGRIEAQGADGAVAVRATIHSFVNDGSISAAAGGTDAQFAQNKASLSTYGPDLVVDKSQNAADGLFSGSMIEHFVNNGTISASTTVGAAAGYSSYGDPGTNNGLISATSTRLIAVGVFAHNGGDFVNNGTIRAEGDLAAYGLRSSTHQAVIDNSGTITAVAHGAGVESVGVSFYYALSTQTLLNSGTITADIAVQTVYMVNGNGLELHNSGTINGRIELNRGPSGVEARSDAIINSGTINGEVRLGGDHDLYDGSGGHQQGAVLGEAGADVLIGTAGADSLSGGGDADFLYGGGGADQLTGGAGADVFAYRSVADSQAGAVDRITDFQTGLDRIDLSALGATRLTLTPAGGITLLAAETPSGTLTVEVAGAISAADVTLSGIASFSGTAGIDLLAATGGGSTLAGGDGDDSLVGSAAADRLDGGTGIDLMVGGAGDDIYVVDRPDDIVRESAGGGNDTVEMRADGLPYGSWVLPDFVENLILVAGNNGALVGNALDNYIRGNELANRIDGGAGADRMEGGAGNDTYVVDNALDQVIEQADGGRDLVQARVSYVLPDNVEDLAMNAVGLDATGNGLDNTIYVQIFSFGGPDPTGDSTILGLGGNDRLSGWTGNDLLDGGDGNDQLGGGDGVDHLIGGAGDDVLAGDAMGDTLEGGDGNDVLWADSAPVVYDWGGTYQPTSANDAKGTDRLIGGAGADDMHCGAGTDLIVYAALSDSTDAARDRIRDFASGTDKIDLSALGPLTLGWTVQGEGASAYSLVSATGAGGTLSIRIDGSVSRADFLYQDAGQTLAGTSGDDQLSGWNGDDVIDLSQGGSDRALGREGADGFYFGAAFGPGDTADGGAGFDTLALQGNYAGTSLAGMTDVEILYLAPGSDTQFGDKAGNSYDYRLTAVDANVAAGANLTVIGTRLGPDEDLAFDGSAETDGSFTIYAGRGTDDLRGGAGGDGFFFGEQGNLTAADHVDGGAGVDTLALRGDYVGAGAVHFAEGGIAGIEVLALLSGHTNEYTGIIVASGYDYDVTMADGNVAAGQSLQLNAVKLAADETVRFDGRAEADGSFVILSGAGDDTLYGGAGNDTLYGGLGADRMEGGAGADTYLYRSTAESTAGSRDTILFGSGDRIDLSRIDAVSGTQANDAFAFVGASAFSHNAGELRAFQSGAGWIVEGDTDGDGVADFVLAVTTAAPLAASDFLL